MATRNRVARGEGEPVEFVGRVRKWKREWQPAGDSFRAKRLLFSRWVPTGERDAAPPERRRPDIVPLENAGGAPVPPGFRPPSAQEGRPAPKIRLRIAGSGGSAAAGLASPGAAAAGASPGTAAAGAPPGAPAAAPPAGPVAAAPPAPASEAVQ